MNIADEYEMNIEDNMAKRSGINQSYKSWSRYKILMKAEEEPV